VKHVDWALKSLYDANIRISATNNGAQTDPEKVKAI